VRYAVSLAQQEDEVIMACIPTISPPLEQASIKDENERKQVMAQNGS
jgi:hypothetical protein